MWFLSGGINHIWILAWLAPVPLLIVVVNLSVIRAAMAAFAASAIGALSWLVAYGPFSFVLVFLVAIPFTLVALVWRAIARRAHPVVATVAFAALAVSSDFFLARISPHGTLGNVAYSQGDLPVILQLASITGIWGISFLLTLVPAAVATAWSRKDNPGLAGTILLIGALPLIATIGFGVVRLAASVLPHEVSVGLAANDVETARRLERGASDEPLQVLRRFADLARTLASSGATVVVLPEKFVLVPADHTESARAILSTVARDQQITIVAGWYVVTPSERRNVAVVFGPDGDVTLEYDKQHLIPGIEWGYRAGNSLGLLKGHVVPTGVAICKDLDFVMLGREYAQAEVGMLLVPAWDFINDRWLHGRMAVLRGVEGGYAIVRTATDGLLTVSDARGRIVAEKESSESADVLLSTTVRVNRGGTFYSRTGDWFAWLCVAVAAASYTIATTVNFRRRRNQRRDTVATDIGRHEMR